MELLSYLRIAVIAVTMLVSSLLIRKLVRSNVKGFRLVWAGYALIMLNLIVGSLFHGTMLPEEWKHSFLYEVGFLTGYVGQTIGLLLVPLGIYQVMRFLMPRLNQSESLYEELVHSINGIVYEVDTRDFRFTFVSNKCHQVLGYTPKQWLRNITWEKLIHPADLNRVTEYCVAATRERRNHSIEFRALCADGRVVWLRDVATVIVEPDQSVKLRGVLLDITERKSAELALEESEKRYQMLFDSSPLPMWVFDLESLAFLAVNKAAINHYGYSRDEFLAMTIKDIRPSEEAPALIEDIVRAKGGESHHRELWKHRKKDGTLIDVEITAHSIDFGGRRARLVLANDVTERLQAAQALQESEERLRTIINAEPQFIKLLAADGTLLQINPAGLAMIEAENEESVRGHCMYPLVLAEYRDSFRMLVESAFRGESGALTFEIVGRRGTRRWLEMHTVPLRNNRGEVVAMLGISSDITRRKSAEETSKQAEEVLRRREAHFRNVIEQIFAFMPEAVIVLTEKLNIYKHNKAFNDIVDKYAAQLHYTKEELTQRILYEIKTKISNGDRTEIRIAQKATDRAKQSR